MEIKDTQILTQIKSYNFYVPFKTSEYFLNVFDKAHLLLLYLGRESKEKGEALFMSCVCLQPWVTISSKILNLIFKACLKLIFWTLRREMQNLIILFFPSNSNAFKDFSDYKHKTASMLKHRKYRKRIRKEVNIIYNLITQRYLLLTF